MSPILFAIDGLPCCGKSEALTKLLHKVIPESRSDAITKVSEKNVNAGILYYELAAVGLPPAPFDRLTYSETTQETCYLYAIQSALKHLYYPQGQEIKFHDPSAGKRDVDFDDEDLNRHFYQMFESLTKDQHSPLSDTQWEKSIPSGIALINVWDIGLNKSVFHFLPALWGHLDNSYLWLFLDLGRDRKELYNTPNLPKSMLYKAKDLIMPYRSTMEYLLHPAMLAKSSSGADRRDVCSVFGVYSDIFEKNQLDGLTEDIEDASIQADLATVINTKEVIPVNPKDPNCWEVLKRKADETIGAQLDSTVKVPLASIFLRSFYYGVDTIYIKKIELEAKAKLLNIKDDEFERFCKVFTSFGSIIDVSLIDKGSDYIILRPIDFIRGLDNIFYPNTNDPKVAKCGIVTTSTAMEIFNADHKFYMDVLVSADLAVSLNENQITTKSSEFPLVDENAHEEYYYLPNVRTSPPDSECHPSSLHLLYSTNSPLRQLQISFTKALLEIKPNSKLVLTETSPINITTFRVISSHTRVVVDFEMMYFGEAVEFRVPPTADEDICAAIIQSCHQMMKNEWGCDKYNFAVMCSKNPKLNTPPQLHRKCHLLPNTKLCETCMSEYGLHKILSIWNTTLRKVSSLNWEYIIVPLAPMR